METHKLSALIRQGAALHPQCFHNYCEVDAAGQIMSTCALGAAIVATGQADLIIKYDPQDINVILALETATDINSPQSASNISIWGQIIARNDNGETRESIATWLEEQGL